MRIAHDAQPRLLTEDVGFTDESALLKHELAYCLGQIKDEAALPSLEKVLRGKSEDPMVRHEVSILLLCTIQIE